MTSEISHQQPALRCLIIEKHQVETGGHEHQLQIPLIPAEDFFGPGAQSRDIVLNIYDPATASTSTSQAASISKVYDASHTRRINQVYGIGDLNNVFVFIEETIIPNEYDVWWTDDIAGVLQQIPANWQTAKDSQHGPGRHFAIILAPAPRSLTTVVNTNPSASNP